MTDRSRPKMKRPAPVGDLLAGALQGSPAARLLKEGSIWQVWGETVGPQIARRAQPAAIRNGILTVAVSNAPWLQQLSFMKSELRDRLNSAIGEELVKDIYLKAGNLPEASEPPPPERRSKLRSVTQEEEARIHRATDELNDPELRRALTALFSTHLADSGDTADD